MSYTYKETSYPSCDGKNTVSARFYIPEGEILGVIQISHGMIDHIGRYFRLAEYFCARGFVVAGGDHLGHGKSAPCPEDLGFFASRDGYEKLIDDVYGMNRLLREEYPDKPIILLGHSMGSFVARLYAVKYPDSIDGIIIHGTSGPNPLLPMGKAVIALTKLLRGERHRSKLVTALAFGSYNSHYPKSEGESAWLTRAVELVEDRKTDPYTTYIFTVSAFGDLFKLIGKCNEREWYRLYPKSLPTLVMSGEDDPVGNYGKGVMTVYRGLESAGLENLSLKLYPGARHELFNETNRAEVFADIQEWIGSVTNKR